MGDDDIANIPVAKGSFTMVKRADFEGEMRANLSFGAQGAILYAPIDGHSRGCGCEEAVDDVS